MDLGLQGKVAIVTGGASGLGRETATYLAREGARLAIADRNEAALGKVCDELRALGTEVEPFALDVSDYGACEGMAAGVRDRFGGVDALVASAGVTYEQFFLQTEPENWDAMLEVNLRGVLNTNHTVGRLMAKQRRGSIVNIASEAGKLGEKRMVVYAATKGGVIAFTKAFALEMGRFTVRVNAVCPGVTRTAMTAGYPAEQMERAAKLYPLGRLGEPADTAAMVTFLASEEASWVTGQAVSISGGFGRS